MCVPGCVAENVSESLSRYLPGASWSLGSMSLGSHLRESGWFLSLLLVSCVSPSVIPFLSHFILETIMEEIEEREAKKSTAL